jgi:hypothetical protein
MTTGVALTVAGWVLALVIIVLVGAWVWRLTATFRSPAARLLVTALVVLVGFPLVLYALLILLASMA